MMTPAFVQAAVISFETISFNEIMQLPNSQRIALMRLREKIKKKIEQDMKKK